MAVFLVSYDAHNERDYDDLYEAMAEHDGVHVLESVWLVKLENSAAEVRNWVVDLLDEHDSVFVLKLKAKHSKAWRNLPIRVVDGVKELA